MKRDGAKPAIKFVIACAANYDIDELTFPLL